MAAKKDPRKDRRRRRYFDHRGDCHDSAHQRTCAGRWRRVVSLSFGADGKRIRRKLSGQTRTEVKLMDLHSELDAGVRTAAGAAVDMAVTDWLADGLPDARPRRLRSTGLREASRLAC